MNKPLSVLIVGIGGYGKNYVDELLDREAQGDYQIVGMVDPYPEKSPRFAEIREREIPLFPSMERFYKEKTADYVCVSSPLQFHCQQTIMALRRGAAVLCEKPLAPTIQEGREMLKVQQNTGKPVGIGYQWSYSEAIQSLKKDIITGLFGKPLRLKTLVVWPRDFKYYNRSSWAGKKKDGNGRWILDSVASNATAHYLHNMFYVLGPEIEKSTWPERLQTELYRANNIENFDTTATRIFTDQGVELLYLVTHASAEKFEPRFCYEFEEATVYFDQDKDSQIVAEFRDGRQKIYGNPFAERFKKIWIMMEAARGKGSYLCGIEAALPHVLCINGMQEAVPDIVDFPEEFIKTTIDEQGNATAVYVEGLVEVLLECYNNWKLPHEIGVKWAKRAGEFILEGYDYFPANEK